MQPDIITARWCTKAPQGQPVGEKVVRTARIQTSVPYEYGAHAEATLHTRYLNALSSFYRSKAKSEMVKRFFIYAEQDEV